MFSDGIEKSLLALLGAGRADGVTQQNDLALVIQKPGQFFAVHSIATDSKGNVYTTETYEGKRIQKFVYKGIGPVARMNQGVLWPARAVR